jgi:hypothetical protein
MRAALHRGEEAAAGRPSLAIARERLSQSVAFPYQTNAVSSSLCWGLSRGALPRSFQGVANMIQASRWTGGQPEWHEHILT